MLILLPDDSPQKDSPKYIPSVRGRCVCGPPLRAAPARKSARLCLQKFDWHADVGDWRDVFSPPENTPRRVWSTVWSHEQVRVVPVCVCVCVCVCVWWSLQCVNFRRCLRRRTAVLKDMTHYWLYRPLSVHPSLPGDPRNKEQIYLPARFAESFPPVRSGTFFSPRHREAETCRVLNQPA